MLTLDISDLTQAKDSVLVQNNAIGKGLGTTSSVRKQLM